MKKLIGDLIKKHELKLKDEQSKVQKEIKHLEEEHEEDLSKSNLKEVEIESNVEDLIVQENNMGIKNNLKEYLKQIKLALNKIKNKKYGICERCGNSISIERLKVNPSAINCLKCAELIEENE